MIAKRPNLNFNPRSPCGERHTKTLVHHRGVTISIHAPRVGSDDRARDWSNRCLMISIHAPRVGSDCPRLLLRLLLNVFQSTLPVWGATRQRWLESSRRNISIHAPRVGSDTFRFLSCLCGAYFNPRSPCGERLTTTTGGRLMMNFNPRSPCGERHLPSKSRSNCFLNFNPRSPCGERHLVRSLCMEIFLFQSTLPVWGATDKIKYVSRIIRISIHAPRVGSDSSKRIRFLLSGISIHAPRVGSDDHRDR